MILYFSGTGNSFYVARELARLLDEDAPACIADINPDDVTSDVTRFIWVFPIYSWGVPPVVVDFMQRIRLDAPVPCWMVCTCGDDVGLAPHQWRKLVDLMGGKPCGIFSVAMPNTYVTLPGFNVDSEAVTNRKLLLAPGRIAAVSAAIAGDRSVVDVVKGVLPFFKSHVIYPWFIRHAMSPKSFRCTEACVGCGLCERQCPMHNIRLDEEHRPVWGDNCAFCLRCYHICPYHAVGYGRATRNKGQYICPL